MNRQWMWLVGLSAALAFTGCSDKNPDTDPDSGADTDDVNDDTDQDTEPEDGSLSLADICSNNDQCESGLCVTLGQGINDSLCSQRCQTAASCGDEGVWDCTEVDSALNDEISVCVPKGLCLDADGDGYGVGPGCLGPDCDDNDPTIYYGAPELCDGKDNDCNDIIDDFTVIDGAGCDTGLFGVCNAGRSECVAGEAICQVLIQPGSLQEECNGLDDDCDGLTDEGKLEDGNNNSVPGTGMACSNGGICQDGLTTCDPSRGVVCIVSGDIVDDSCDGIDNNCSGTVDDAVPGLNMPCVAGSGACAVQGITVCDVEPYDPVICNAVPDGSNSTPEICDYIDNDCDGVVDNGFVKEVDNGFGKEAVYHTDAHCGACNNDCTAFWANNAYAETVKPKCDVDGTNARCGYDCKAGFVDIDDEPSNGCEHEINLRAVYVAPANKGGDNDAVNGVFCGVYDHPCADITKAIEMAAFWNGASQARDLIVVAEGIYRERIVLPNGVSIQGGHNPTNWTRIDAESRSIIVGTSTSGDTGDRYTVLAENITKKTELSGFTIIGEDGRNGENSVGVLVRNSTDKLTIKDNVIRAGLGGQGTSGSAGEDGNSGKNGLAGNNGQSVDLTTCNATNERAGGTPGATQCQTPGTSTNVNVGGGSGANAICPSYGGAGAAPQAGKGSSPGASGFTAFGRGLYGSACYPRPDKIAESFPRDGVIGGLGTDGQGGLGASSATGALSPQGMWRSESGKSGVHGNHGSGGGGGGASHGTMKCTGIDGDVFKNCDTTGLIGASGGGGGAGGCAAAAASGGGGGGGSIAVYMHFTSTPASLPTITNNVLERNLGGQGGDGGIGGRGGDGGRGATGGTVPALQTYCPQAGRSGGNGGRGGHGGGGGGGAGGISYDFAVFGASISGSQLTDNNTFSVPAGTSTAGVGGPGGGSMGLPGKTGVAGQSGQLYNP